jgi:Ca2+-binding EF-hand superfamily protein
MTLGVIMLFVGAGSTVAFAFSKHTVATADSNLQRLLRLMDKDLNGTVSKTEFIEFMSAAFDRLDVNRDGRLEPNEVRPMNIPNWVIRTSPTKADR